MPAGRGGRGDHRPGHRRVAGRRARPPRISAGPATTSTRWPARPRPGTCSSAARRPPAATTRSSPRSPTCATPASRSRRSTPDGSSVITKHPGTGGAVTVGTVTAQLLYEVAGPRYAGPDVTLRLDTVRLSQDGPDRVRIGGVRGEPPPPTLKVSLNAHRRIPQPGGVRAHRAGHRGQGPAGPASSSRAPLPAGARVDAGPHRPRRRRDRGTGQRDAALRGARQRRQGHRPGVLRRRGRARAGQLSRLPPHRAAGRRAAVRRVHRGLRGPGPGPARRRCCPTAGAVAVARSAAPGALEPADAGSCRTGVAADGPTRRVPLGTVAGARSGDKGGDANVGVWARDEAAWPWLAAALTADRLRELLPETAGLPVHPLPAAEPARGQLRHRGPARRGRRRGRAVRSAGQGGSANGCGPATSRCPRSCWDDRAALRRWTTARAAYAGEPGRHAGQAGRDRRRAGQGASRAAGRSTPTGTGAAASCWPASGSSCCWTPAPRSWSCRRWRPGAPSSRSAAAWSPGSASSRAPSA